MCNSDFRLCNIEQEYVILSSANKFSLCGVEKRLQGVGKG
jgi:hypothetical protein